MAEILTLFDTAPTGCDRKVVTPSARRLTSIASQVMRSRDAAERARLLVVLGSAVAAELESAIADAREAGFSWRQLAARLDVPYQTLHRRYRLLDWQDGRPRGEA